MKHVILALSLVFCIALMANAEDTKLWFDMENCGFCKHLMAEPGLMDNMAWEHHDIKNGVLIMTVIDPKYDDAYQKAVKAMQQTGNEMMAGKQVYMCGHCETYGMLMMSGINMEVVKTSAGEITLMTSDKPEMIEKLHVYSKKNQEAMARMEKMDPHHGHNH